MKLASLRRAGLKKILLFSLLLFSLPVLIRLALVQTDIIKRASQDAYVKNGDFTDETTFALAPAVSLDRCILSKTDLLTMPVYGFASDNPLSPTLSPSITLAPSPSPTITATPTSLPSPTAPISPTPTAPSGLGGGRDGLYSIRQRFGFGFAPCDYNKSCYPVVERTPEYRQLNAGWYHDWLYGRELSPNQKFGGPRAEAGLEYMAMVGRVLNRQTKGNVGGIGAGESGQCAIVYRNIKNNPNLNPNNTVWTIGNEIGFDDTRTSAEYADDFVAWKRCLYQIADRLTQETGRPFSYKVASGAIIQLDLSAETNPRCVGRRHANSYESFLRNYISKIRQDYGEEWLPDLFVHHGYTPCDGSSGQHSAANWRNVELFKRSIREQRLVLKELGLQNRELWIKEFSPLTGIYEYNFDRLVTYLDQTMRFMADTRDFGIGMPDDNYRLVQKWAWFQLYQPLTADGTYFLPSVALMDRTDRLNAAGIKFKELVEEYVARERAAQSGAALWQKLQLAFKHLRERVFNTQVQASNVLTILPEQDSTYSTWLPDKDRSAEITIEVRPDVANASLVFDLSAIPQGSAIAEANLILNKVSQSNEQAITLGVADRARALSTDVNFDVVDKKTTTISQTLDSQASQTQINVKSLLESAGSKITLLLVAKGGRVEYDFASLDHPDTNLRPKLEIRLQTAPRPTAANISATPAASPTPTTPPAPTSAPTPRAPYPTTVPDSVCVLGKLASHWQIMGNVDGSQRFDVLTDGAGRYGQLVSSGNLAEIGIAQELTTPPTGAFQILADVYVTTDSPGDVELGFRKNQGQNQSVITNSESKGQWQRLRIRWTSGSGLIWLTTTQPNTAFFVTNIRVMPG